MESCPVCQHKGLTKHPDFKWTNRYIENTSVTNVVKYMSNAAKGHQGLKFKFGVQIPKNASHALYLDQIENNHLWRDAIQVEIDFINSFETFRVLEEGEKLPPGYVKIPYQLIFN